MICDFPQDRNFWASKMTNGMQIILSLLPFAYAVVQADSDVFYEATGVKCTTCTPSVEGPTLSLGNTSPVGCAVLCTRTDVCASFALDAYSGTCYIYRTIGGTEGIPYFTLHWTSRHTQQGWVTYTQTRLMLYISCYLELTSSDLNMFN